MQSKSDAPVVERRAQSHREIGTLVESRTDTLALLGELASKQPFKPEHDTQLLLQNFCESLIDYTASAHFQLYRHIDENKERRVAVREVAEVHLEQARGGLGDALDLLAEHGCHRRVLGEPRPWLAGGSPRERGDRPTRA